MENKKRICIITWYKVPNYGAYLQAYAMKRVLEEKGCDVFFYDYDRKLLPYNKYNLVKHPLQTICRKLLKKQIENNADFYSEKDKIFKTIISKTFEVAQLNNEYLLCIIGSDEIFNIESGYNSFQFSSPVKAIKTISYAASFGETSIEMIDFYKVRNVLQTNISNLAGISVRDENSMKLIKNLTDKDAVVHIDPVLLYGFKKECGLMKNPKKDPYIVFYSYGSHLLKKEYINEIIKFAKENGLTIISCGYYHSWCDENINCSPFDFISYVKHASYVITSTFHGAVFSILLNKQFCVFPQNNSNKLCYLLKQFNLEKQIVKKTYEIKNCLNRKLDNTQLIIQQQEKSNNFLGEFL